MCPMDEAEIQTKMAERAASAAAYEASKAVNMGGAPDSHDAYLKGIREHPANAIDNLKLKSDLLKEYGGKR